MINYFYCLYCSLCQKHTYKENIKDKNKVELLVEYIRRIK